MAKNVMAEVAKALGLELGEEFSIGDSVKYVLLDDGLFKKIGELTYWQVGIENLLTGDWDVVKLPKQILDDVEKKYLSNIIKPFRDRIDYIAKVNFSNTREYIFIKMKNYEKISLPSFIAGTMYKGMENDKDYTLKDLGLQEV